MTSPSLPPALANLAQTITRLQNRIAQLERNQRTAQLGSSSIEGGALVANDPSGNTAIVIGQQTDGSVTATTTGTYLPPQTPSTPQALMGILAVWVVWDGLMADGSAPYLDFQAVQVHCSTTPGFTPTPDTLQGTIPTAGLFTVGSLTGGTTYYVCLVAVNAAGVTGTPSSQATADAGTVADSITAGSITAGQVSFTARNIGGITTTVSATQPSPAVTSDLWFNSSDSNRLYQYNGSTWVAYQFGTSAIAAGSVTAALIAANTITATQIAAGTITASKIAASTITAAQIASGSITASLLAAGIVVAGIVDATTITGAQIVADGTSGQFLIYNGPPGAGNLAGSWSGAPGVDANGNTFGQDLVVGPPSGPQAALARTGGGGQGAALQFLLNTTDVGTSPMLLSQVINAGTAGQYLQTLLQGPGNSTGTGNQFNLVLNSDSDDGSTPAILVLADGNQTPFLAMENTGTPAMFIGSVPGGASTFIPVTVNGGFLMYGTTSGGQVVRTFAGAGTQTFTPPAGVTVLDRVEHIGGGAGGQDASGPGGGSGEYAAATNVAVTPGHTYTWSNGAGGAQGSSSHPAGGAGGNTASTWDAITVTAHGAPANGASLNSSGGTGSAAPIHRDGSGGTGYTGGTNGGGGGAGAPNRYGPGAAGPANNQTRPGAGGAAAAGGLAGWGAWGGWGSGVSSVYTTGGYGGGTGAGGGTGGADPSLNGSNGGPGGTGITQITYTLPGVTQILASMTSQPLTDTSGNVTPTGFQGQIVAVKPTSSPSVPETWHPLTLASSAVGWSLAVGRAMYRLTAENEVALSLLHVTTSTTPGTYNVDGTVIFTLPSGYRPPSTHEFPVAADVLGVATSPNGKSAKLAVNPDGTVTCFNLSTAYTFYIACEARIPLAF